MTVKYSGRNLFRVVALQLIIFFYIYSVPLKGIPGGVGSRIMLTLLGIVLLSIQIVKKLAANNVRIPRDMLLIISSIVGMGAVAVVSNLVNLTTDFSLIKYAGSFIYMLLAGHFVVWMFRKTYQKADFCIVGNHIILAGLMQVLISLGMFLVPALYDLLIAIQNVDPLTDERLGAVSGLRLIGVGSTFFASGIVHSYMLILIATLIRVKRHSSSMMVFYSIAFLLLFALGTMMARTTLIGAIMAFVVLVWPRTIKMGEVSKNIFRVGANFLLIILLLGSLTIFLSKETKELLANASEFGFELFINYAKGEGVSSASTDELKDMFIWPSDVGTYLIGDGRFVNPQDPIRYYMGTDVGYLRLIYCFGITGTIAFLIVQFMPIAICINKNRSNPIVVKFFVMSFLLMVILNVKGFTDIFFLSILFYYISKDNILHSNITEKYGAVS